MIQAVNKLSAAGFTEADESLIQLLADQSGVAMQRYGLQQEALEGAEMRREMDLAKIVQEADPQSAAGGERLAVGRLDPFGIDHRRRFV